MDAASLVDAINRRHGAGLHLLREKPGGESGSARWLIDESGNRYLLKFGNGREFRWREAAAITARIRVKGYPATEYVITGEHRATAYVIRKAIAGTRMKELTPETLKRILALNELQKNAARNVEVDWPARIVESIESGFTDWCRHDSLADYSRETSEMLEEVKRTVPARSRKFRTSDAVHFDFQSANIVVHNREITGVIDWEGCCAGDRAFDLVTLAYYSLEQARFARVLIDRACVISGSVAVALYLGHTILRQMDWSIRHHKRAVILRYLGTSRRALEMLRDLRG
jgi:hypothetical protein